MVEHSTVPRAALFDVGGTLLHPLGDRAAQRKVVLSRLEQRFGPRDWYAALLDADLLSELLVDDPAEPLRQRTLAVLRRWLEGRGAPLDGIDLDELRRRVEVPREAWAVLAPGARDALVWLRSRGLRVVLVSNTLWTGDDELRADLPSLGIDDVVDAVVTSHSVGFRKPHHAIFERAVELAHTSPHEAFMVGDEPYADVVGPKRIGMRAIWLRLPPPRPHAVGAPRDLRAEPDATIGSLAEIPEVVERWLRRA